MAFSKHKVVFSLSGNKIVSPFPVCSGRVCDCECMWGACAPTCLFVLQLPHGLNDDCTAGYVNRTHFVGRVLYVVFFLFVLSGGCS